MIIDRENSTLATILEMTDCKYLRALEIGCGDGRLSMGLAKNTRSLIAIDSDTESLVLGIKRSPGVDFRVGSGIGPAVDSEVSILCNVYEDETNVLLNTVATIDRHVCRVLQSQEIFTEWEFKDDREQLGWLRNFYDAAPGTNKEGQVLALLGHKQHSRPLVLSDKLVFTVLQTTI